jgi:hypothetical protein
MLNFKVKVLDNFLNEKDFAELSNYAKNLASSKKIDIFHNEIDRNNKVIKSTINEEFLTRINNNYLPIASNILKDLNNEKLNLFSYSDFTIVKTNKNSKFPIHDDAPNKLLSGVIFLYPQDNKGTIFYNNKSGEGKTEIDWKINRAVFFSRKERETWHSYEGDKKNDRIALVYNLMTYRKNIREICRIEKKNYIFCMIRYLINPYLLRFLKVTI